MAARSHRHFETAKGDPEAVRRQATADPAAWRKRERKETGLDVVKTAIEEFGIVNPPKNRNARVVFRQYVVQPSLSVLPSLQV